MTPLTGMKVRRRAAGVTQQQAGAWIGVTKQGFGKIESGSSPLDIRRAAIVAARLGCQLEELL